ncbi:gamma-glutamyltransferase [Moraxella catarrhalis]|uniref:gamma-glutamyltransferase n=1 Tax=Moraxella catarrhalis TaxID=480 RepID=UPI003872DDED
MRHCLACRDFIHEWVSSQAIELPSTSHISIVDKAGNVLSMTTSIENAFGSTLMANGYWLNFDGKWLPAE